MLPIPTTNGHVLGFTDTFPLSSHSSASLVAAGHAGGCSPVDKWLGIPYARAERWRRPTNPEGWEGVRKVWEYGTMFPQGGEDVVLLDPNMPGVVTRDWQGQSEDSHTLNLYAPTGLKEGDEVAVIVYIPSGGGLNMGRSDIPMHDPTEWIRRNDREGRHLIVVTGNYRTNIYGFCSSQDIKDADSDGISGNYGLHDVITIFEWVRSNISSFSGSPSNVTASGESAGAFIVSVLTSGKNLFRRAILQSGAPATLEFHPVSTAYPSYASISKEYAQDLEGGTAQERVDRLRGLPWQELLRAHQKWFAGSVYCPIEEGNEAVWDRSPMAKLMEGKWDDSVEGVMMGTNEDEGTLFAFGMKLTTTESLEGLIAEYPASFGPRLRVLYPPSALVTDPADPTYYTSSPATHFIADETFLIPTHHLAVAMTRSRPPCPVYMYRLRQSVDAFSIKGPFNLGVIHTTDLPLVFNFSSLWEPESEQAKTAQAMGSRWADFVTGGVPDPYWKRFAPDAPSWFVFDVGGMVQNESLRGWKEKDVALWSEVIEGRIAALASPSS